MIKKGVATIFMILGTMVAIDCLRIFQLAYLRPQDGAGIGIYILGGIIELNDKVTYSNVPNYLFPLLIMALILITVATLLFKTKAVCIK